MMQFLPLVLLLAAQAPQQVQTPVRAWKFSPMVAEKTMTLPPEFERIPINDPNNCLLLIRAQLVYTGAAGSIAAPRVVVLDEAGNRYLAWGNTNCRGSDGPCSDYMGWILSATHETADSTALSPGDTISTGSMTWYYEIPRSVRTLRVQ
ncbi:MAG: hypothetical protein FIB01_02675, partial [Gemmatimonadetes bacterium]|nr:hypothetical protein [Gemmatimonadota bacterium]